MPYAPVAPPHRPHPGLVLEVQWSETDNWLCCDRYTVARVNSRSFYVRGNGGMDRHLLVEWTAWIDARLAEGPARIDGIPLASPHRAPAGSSIDLAARDARLMRGARDVLKKYGLQRTDHEGRVDIAVTRGRSAWTVRAWIDWSMPPVCDCPDAVSTRENTVCKHVVACCLGFDDLRCQLLDILV
jgi:hypothetical protein